MAITFEPWNQKKCKLCDGTKSVRTSSWYHDRNGFLRTYSHDAVCPKCKGRGFTK